MNGLVPEIWRFINACNNNNNNNIVYMNEYITNTQEEKYRRKLLGNKTKMVKKYR